MNDPAKSSARMVRTRVHGIVRRVLLAMALVVLVPFASGCGASIATSYAVDFPFLRAHSSHTIEQRPLAPPRVRTRIWLEMDRNLKVQCRVQSVSPWVRYATTDSFDDVGRVWVGFMAVSEAGGATSILVMAKDMDPTAKWTVAGLMLADAAGALTYAILEPSSYEVSRHDGPGRPHTSWECPRGVRVSSPGGTAVVPPEGPPGPGIVGVIRGSLDMNVGIQLSWGGRAVVWYPSAEERCRMARQIRHPQAARWCGRPGGGYGGGGQAVGRWPGGSGQGHVGIDVEGTLGWP